MICYKFSCKGKFLNYLNFLSVSVSVYLFARKKIYKSERTGGIFLARKLKLKPWGDYYISFLPCQRFSSNKAASWSNQWLGSLGWVGWVGWLGKLSSPDAFFHLRFLTLLNFWFIHKVIRVTWVTKETWITRVSRLTKVTRVTWGTRVKRVTKMTWVTRVSSVTRVWLGGLGWKGWLRWRGWQG